MKFKEETREQKIFRRRVTVAAVLVAVLTGALVIRLIFLQVIEYQRYRTLSRNNRVRVVPLPPTRGLIYDRNGVLLAENVPSYSLEIVPAEVKHLKATIARLRRIVSITPADLRRFHELMRERNRFDSVPLRTRLDDQEVARFAVNRYRFPGVDIHARLTRNYPLGEFASHLIGYVGRINERDLRHIDVANYRGSTYIGKTGVEASYERVLHGKVGYEQVEVNAQGRALRVLARTDPVPGKNLYLTIDANLQRVAQQALGEEKGAVVAINPRTGGVLAMVSTPEFNPNAFVDGIDSASYRALLRGPGRPLFNRDLNGQYPPGSTIKPFIGLGGLELGAPLANGRVFCPGYFILPGSTHVYRGWKPGGHGWTDLHKAIAQSCDIYFYQLALQMGINEIHNFLIKFGFGAPTGVDLPDESGGLIPSPKWKRRVFGKPWYTGETLITGIGQGFMLVTPLQLASATATMAERGIRYRPHVVGRIQNPLTGRLRDIAPQRLRTIGPGDPGDWKRIIDGMIAVVNGPHGTARRIGIGEKYLIAGKTGTAQVYTLRQGERYDESKLPKRLRDNALFIAFAPAEDPRIAVAVVVEHGGSGASAAAPIARTVINAYLNGLASAGEAPATGGQAHRARGVRDGR